MRRLHSEDGVTLVELLVATAIMGIIIPALTGAMVIGWRTTDSTIARLSDSRNREITPSLWTRDVQSTKTVDRNSAVTTCLTGGDTLLARFTWAETPATGPPAVTRVAAWVWTGSTTKLVERRFCATGALITSSVTTAHDVAVVPVPTCRTATGITVPACGATTVVVDLSVTDPSGAYLATGRRRST